MFYNQTAIAEQKEITNKLENLMQKFGASEQEIKSSEANAKMLMQAVLKEAFNEKETTTNIWV